MGECKGYVPLQGVCGGGERGVLRCVGGGMWMGVS